MPDETAESLSAQMQQMQALSPAGIKIGSCGDLARDTRRLEICRAALGDSTPLMIDFYWQFESAKPLLSHLRAWEQLGVGWIEDPFAFDDFESCRELAASTSIPLAIGDEQSGRRHMARLMDEAQVKVLRLDATVCGGVTGFGRIAADAARRGVPVSCHVFHTLHAHLAGSHKGVTHLEKLFEPLGIDAMHLLWKSDLLMQQGMMTPAESPGIGYAWDFDALKRFGQEL